MLGTGRLRMSKSKLDKNRSDCKIEGWCRCFGEVAVGDGLIICMTTHVHAGIGVTVAGSAAPRMIMNCSVRHICRAAASWFILEKLGSSHFHWSAKGIIKETEGPIPGGNPSFQCACIRQNTPAHSHT